MDKEIEDPKSLVREGYDKISYAYRRDDYDFETSNYRNIVEWLIPILAPHAVVLDLGCGCGVPVTKTLSTWYGVTGVDLSPVQIARARVLVPDAEFICADMTALDFPPSTFDAVTAFYSIIHIPKIEHPSLYEKITRWLKPGGYFLATVGTTNWTGTEPDWHGAEMYWSHPDAETTRQLWEANGFEILREGFIPEGEGGHTVYLGRKA